MFLEVEGLEERVEAFLLRLEREKPPLSVFTSIEPLFLDPAGYSSFRILESGMTQPRAVILPDIATCPDCLEEILDPGNRRYRYPFTNCTACGPRYSIIEKLPYDRPNTTMRIFEMCSECRQEYENPGDRRFHAQPIACPACGPHIVLWNHAGDLLAEKDQSLKAAARLLEEGAILAFKGLGGFQLLVDARDNAAVSRLRQLKHREEKPFAIMVQDIKEARKLCVIAPMEERLLKSPESPIVLLRKNKEILAYQVAPGCPDLGVLLPCTPLHHLLFGDIGFPVVATSGNRTDEPICMDEYEALDRLKGIADAFLVHNRPIRRYVDDSVARVILKREMLLRRARGYAPLPIPLHKDTPPLLGVGAHLKNTVALSLGNEVVLSQHIGDLESVEAFNAFKAAVEDLQELFQVRPAEVVCDLHPDYLSSRFARERSPHPLAIQHHEAHILACMAENALAQEVLGISWDGIGLGSDRTLWGGEFLLVEPAGSSRLAHLRPFLLPGGESAVKEPRRSAIGLLYELLGESCFLQEHLAPFETFSDQDLKVIHQALKTGLNSPGTTSMGRLFDAVASLCGIRQVDRYEGQAAMELESSAVLSPTESSYDFVIHGVKPPYTIDWGPMVRSILDDLEKMQPVGEIAGKFHNSLAEMIFKAAVLSHKDTVVLSGGCFQNRILLEKTVPRLKQEGFRVYWPQRVPPNDGGIALGQVYGAAHRLPQMKDSATGG